MPGKAVYVIIAWVPAALEDSYLGWLDGGHIAEVTAQAGFLGARRIRLNQTDTEGRNGHMVIYEAGSADSVEAYVTSEARQRFIAEGARFEGVVVQRFDGPVTYTT